VSNDLEGFIARTNDNKVYVSTDRTTDILWLPMKNSSGLIAAFIGVLIITAPAHSVDKQSSVACERIIDYTDPAAPGSSEWFSVNDNVMGGRSLGSFKVLESSLRFLGSINTNGGGFASIRHKVSNFDFSQVDRLRLHVKSDGRPYSLNLRDWTSNQLRIAHRANLNAPGSDKFQSVEVPMDAFRPTFRGRAVNADPIKLNEIQSLSVMLSDYIDGPFTLEIAWIELCRPSS